VSDDLPQSPEQEYFATLEAQFARLRGANVLLSPADWEVARVWYERGIPVDLVVRTMELLLARRAERELATPGRKGRRIGSLRYFAPAVEAAWDELRALTATGHVGMTEPLDVPARLAALAEALPDALPRRADRAGAIRALQGAPPEIEAALAALDAAVLADAVEALPAATRAGIESTLDERVRALGERLPDEEVARARRLLRDRLVRQRLGLPVLSLFSDDPALEPPPPGAETG
jgi:hypothetical protein